MICNTCAGKLVVVKIRNRKSNATERSNIKQKCLTQIHVNECCFSLFFYKILKINGRLFHMKTLKFTYF
jgi:hypothetical protein